MVKTKKARPRIGRPTVAAADRRGKHVRVLTTSSDIIVTQLKLRRSLPRLTYLHDFTYMPFYMQTVLF